MTIFSNTNIFYITVILYELTSTSQLTYYNKSVFITLLADLHFSPCSRENKKSFLMCSLPRKVYLCERGNESGQFIII